METRLEPRRDFRFLEYCCIAAGGTGIALLAGNVWPAAIAAAAAALAIVGIRRSDTLSVDLEVDYNADRLIEGDRLETTFTVTHPEDVELDVAPPPSSPTGPLGPPEIMRATRSPGATTLVVTRDARQWGYHPAGTTMVRATSSNSMVNWEFEVPDPGGVRVLPTPTRLTELLNPNASQATAGSHPARIVTGDGVEFVDIREYLPGDRVRDINWKVTARRGEPHINRRRPDRGGDVIIIIDALPDGGWENSEVGRRLLHRAGQATWALVKNHLAVQDRVGLIVRRSEGVIYLPPGGGVRAQYQLIEALLNANAVRTNSPTRHLRQHQIPSTTLTVTVSSLANVHSMHSVASLGANGRATGVLAIAPNAQFDTGLVDPATARLAEMAFEARVAYVRRAGVSVSVWDPREDVNRAVSRLGEMTRRIHRRGAA